MLLKLLKEIFPDDLNFKIFNAGYCDSFALALYELFNYKIGVIRGWYSTGGFADGHAFCFIDKNIGVDFKGKRRIEQILKEVYWQEKMKSVKAIKISKEELEYAFGMEGINRSLVERAKIEIKNNMNKYKR